MTDDTKQDHPGPEWVRANWQYHGHAVSGWLHPVLNIREESPEACRAISAAALAWERMRADAAGSHELCQAQIQELEAAYRAAASIASRCVPDGKGGMMLMGEQGIAGK